MLVGGLKLAGILVEGRPQDGWAVLGIGINVAVDPAALPEELRDSAATLGAEPAAVETVLARLLVALEQWIAAGEAAVLDACRARDALRDAPVRWSDGEGTGAGISDDGALLVRTHEGRVLALDAGEVHLGRRPSRRPPRRRTVEVVVLEDRLLLEEVVLGLRLCLCLEDLGPAGRLRGGLLRARGTLPAPAPPPPSCAAAASPARAGPWGSCAGSSRRARSACATCASARR